MASNLPESSPRKPFTNWIWFLLLFFLSTSAFLWGISRWQEAILAEKQKIFPFYQVTNREFSLFLWQNPEFFKEYAQLNLGHIAPDDDILLLPENAEALVSVPSKVLFRYHVWDRLIKRYPVKRSLPTHLFAEFLENNQEWLPRYWKAAPAPYRLFMENRETFSEKELPPLIPLEVKIAYQGWLNYFKEWEEIQQLHPTQGEMESFLDVYPHYARSYWRNILRKEKPNYLINLYEEGQHQKLNEDEMTTFLQIAIYNYFTMTKPSG